MEIPISSGSSRWYLSLYGSTRRIYGTYGSRAFWTRRKREMVFFGNDDGIFVGDDHKMDVKIKQEIVDGDTIMKAIVNGEEVNADDYDMKEGNFKWKSKSGNVIVIDIDDDHNDDHKEKDVRIIKKKIIMRDGK